MCVIFLFSIKHKKKYFLDFSLVWYIHVYVYSMISIFRCELDSVRRSKWTFNSLMICQIHTCTNMNHLHVSVTYTKLTRLLFENTWQFMFLSSSFFNFPKQKYLLLISSFKTNCINRSRIRQLIITSLVWYRLFSQLIQTHAWASLTHSIKTLYCMYVQI